MSNFVNILCCLCGKSIQPNNAALCIECLKSEVDITETVQNRDLKVHQCRRCMKWQAKNDHFIHCETESAELLALLLKRVPGLDRHEIVDASFIWTEPHSLKIKVKVTLKRSVLNGVLLQQQKVLEYSIENRQCGTCSRSFSNQTWRAIVQLRQRVEQKKTLFQLEQKLLEMNLTNKMIDIRTQRNGIDFYFAEKPHALQFIDWIKGVVPFRLSQSKKLVGVDNHSNISKDQLTLRCDIVPLCCDDLVILPSSRVFGTSLSGIPALITDVCSAIHIIDPLTLLSATVNGEKYFKVPFQPLVSSSRMIEFVVLNVDPVSNTADDPSNPYLLADIEVARSVDLGVNDDRFVVRSHLGRKLQPGYNVLGYDLRDFNYNDSEISKLKVDLPDIILVRRAKSNINSKKRKKSKKRSAGKATEDIDENEGQHSETDEQEKSAA